MHFFKLVMGLFLLLTSVRPAAAHEGFPLIVSIEQTADDLYLLRLTVPPSIPEFARPNLRMPTRCRFAVPRDRELEASRSILYRCPGGLGGEVLELGYPTGVPAVPALARIAWRSGETRSVLASPGQTTIALPAPENAAGVATQYFALGVRHILEGYDHLLFLACLLIIAGSRKRVLLTVTGFTAGHAATITAVSLGITGLPVPPVEAAIALSIMFLAAEISRSRRDTLTWRYPVAVSSAFGLLHGLGFAAVLREIGLPQIEVPVALVFFNIGIEVGQLLFVTMCAGLAHSLHLLRQHGWLLGKMGSALLQRSLAYAIGGLAAFWFIERVAAA